MRIFWFGMHELLTRTELPRLRQLGYEVFNPPYLSEIVDQSAQSNWESNFHTTLPDDVFAKLANTNFYYSEIDEEIAELLNEYFDVGIVTITPHWLAPFARAFRGRIIYRTYGQHGVLSEEILNLIDLDTLLDRESFIFSPHTASSLTNEARWLADSAVPIPYCISEDIPPLADTWNFKKSNNTIAVHCPRIDNAFFAQQYEVINRDFVGPEYRLFGKQMVETNDTRLIGTLERDDFLKQLSASRLFLNHYEHGSVCYLPPIEASIIGMPVLCRAGSLFAKMQGVEDAPNVCSSNEKLDALAKKLVADPDKGLIKEMVEAQKTIKQLYLPDSVWPVFDQTMSDLLEKSDQFENPTNFYDYERADDRYTISKKARKNAKAAKIEKPIFISTKFEIYGYYMFKNEGVVDNAEGIGKVVGLTLGAIAKKEDKSVFTVFGIPEHAANIYDFLLRYMPEDFDSRRLIIQRAEERPEPTQEICNPIWHLRRWMYKPKQKGASETLSINLFGVTIFLTGVWFANLPLERSIWLIFLPLMSFYLLPDSTHAQTFVLWRKIFFRVPNPLKAVLMTSSETLGAIARKAFNLFYNTLYQCWYFFRNIKNNVENGVNNRINPHVLFVPHYHAFPELLYQNYKCRSVTYIPDFIPHFYPPHVFGVHEKEIAVGRKIAERSDIVITNSKFSAEYLPKTALKVRSNKLRVYPLPLLINASEAHLEYDDLMSDDWKSTIKDKNYFFYPTQDRPNKRLIDLVAAFQIAKKQSPDVLKNTKLVLTCPVNPTYQEILGDDLYFSSKLSDDQMKVAYQNTKALIFPSEMEGNMPTQVMEALIYRAPIIAARMPLLVAELGDKLDILKTFEIGDRERLAQLMAEVMETQDTSIADQEQLRDFIISKHSKDKFEANVASVFLKTR